jgi:hypothetical protein
MSATGTLGGAIGFPDSFDHPRFRGEWFEAGGSQVVPVQTRTPPILCDDREPAPVGGDGRGKFTVQREVELLDVAVGGRPDQ